MKNFVFPDLKPNTAFDKKPLYLGNLRHVGVVAITPKPVRITYTTYKPVYTGDLMCMDFMEIKVEYKPNEIVML